MVAAEFFLHFTASLEDHADPRSHIDTLCQILVSRFERAASDPVAAQEDVSVLSGLLWDIVPELATWSNISLSSSQSLLESSLLFFSERDLMMILDINFPLISVLPLQLHFPFFRRLLFRSSSLFFFAINRLSSDP